VEGEPLRYFLLQGSLGIDGTAVSLTVGDRDEILAEGATIFYNRTNGHWIDFPFPLYFI